MIMEELRKRPKKRKSRFTLTLIIALVVLAVMLVALAISFGFVSILLHTGAISGFEDGFNNVGAVGLIMVGMSLVIGFGLTVITSKTPLNPIGKVITQMERLSQGDFDARLTISRPWRDHPVIDDFCQSFNKMAEELGSTEMLRADFINNFSHEFKTPIVSIAGFAKLLKKGNLTDEQRAEYLDIIEEESLRLSSMATNVLTLTKVENQGILSDITAFNLSEQIRSCVVITADKWTKKDITLDMDFDEHTVMANEELLKQVWLNLVDNAIKFSPRGGTVSIEISENKYSLSVVIKNQSPTLTEEQQKHIFNKFYQADKSHSTEGYGIGLALVKHITELHRGGVFVHSENFETAFTVVLPKKQNSTSKARPARLPE